MFEGWDTWLCQDQVIEIFSWKSTSYYGLIEVFCSVDRLLSDEFGLQWKKLYPLWIKLWREVHLKVLSFNRIFIEWFLHMLGYPKHLIVTCFVRALEKVYDNEMFHLTKRYEELSNQVQQQMINHRSWIEILLIFIVLGWFVSTSASSLLVFSWCSWQNSIFSLIFDQNINISLMVSSVARNSIHSNGMDTSFS